MRAWPANYRFTVVDVRDKSNPVIGQDASYNHNWLNEAMMVQVSPLNPNIVFAVAWRGHSLTAMDVTNKSAPVRAGVYRDTTNAVTNWAWGLAVKDDRAYVTTAWGWSSKLCIFDVSDPTDMELIGIALNPTRAWNSIWASSPAAGDCAEGYVRLRRRAEYGHIGRRRRGAESRAECDVAAVQ